MADYLNGIEQSATRQIVGDLTDGHSTATLYGYAKQNSEHNHGVTYTYPLLAAAVTLTAGGGAWDPLPAPTEIIPANTITKDFDIHWLHIGGLSANGEFIVALYQGAGGSETLIGEVPVVRNAVQSQEGSLTLITPLMDANTRISAALASSPAAANTADIKISYHEY